MWRTSSPSGADGVRSGFIGHIRDAPDYDASRRGQGGDVPPGVGQLVGPPPGARVTDQRETEVILHDLADHDAKDLGGFSGGVSVHAVSLLGAHTRSKGRGSRVECPGR